MIAETELVNPTDTVDVDFVHFFARRQSVLQPHLAGDVPDYSFALDATLRRQIASIGPVRSIAQIMVSTRAPLYRQLYNIAGVAVGPDQYRHIHSIGEECAKLLGIGVPQIFIIGEGPPNAFTISTDDVTPVIVLTASLVEAMGPQELKFVIGHECGHIHNLHGVYNTAVVMMVNPAAKVLFQKLLAIGATANTVKLLAGAFQGGLKLFMLRWSRCAEITCDRAGLICCGDVQVAERALVRLVIGASEQLRDFNVQAYLKQFDQNQSAPLRLFEFSQTHPLIPKRIAALRLFADCEVLSRWCPEMKRAMPIARSIDETDRLCEDVLGVIKSLRKSTVKL